jgi:hypothetical protein
MKSSTVELLWTFCDWLTNLNNAVLQRITSHDKSSDSSSGHWFLWGYWHCGHSWPIVPASGDNEDDSGEADWM